MARTFAQIKTEVLALVIDTPSAVQTYVGNYVNRAARKIQTKHGFKWMEAEQTYTTAVGNRILQGDIRPNDWFKPRGRPYYTDNFGATHEIAWVSSSAEAKSQYGDNPEFNYGSPRLIYEDDLPAEFNIYPFPDGMSDYDDGEYRITVPYWKFLPDMISDGDTNWLTNNAEMYLIFQATAEAYYANVDNEQAQTWETRAMRERADAITLDKDRRLSETDVLVPHLGARRPHTLG